MSFHLQGLSTFPLIIIYMDDHAFYRETPVGKDAGFGQYEVVESEAWNMLRLQLLTRFAEMKHVSVGF